MMRRLLPFLVVPAVAVLFSAPALAQVEGRSNVVDVYVGYFLGDDVADQSIMGSTPELDDDATFGVRYGYQFTQRWGIEISLGYSPGTITDISGLPPGGGDEIDVDLFLVDVDAVYNFNPDAKIVGYVVFGVGGVTADLDSPIPGPNNTTIEDDDGFTANVGGGARFFITDNFNIRAEARYRFIDALISEMDDSLNTVEGTVAAEWVF
ncbi:MAG: outer membrane beta-barrel domain-containing protein [Acidobacteriota bacterium]